MHLMLSLSISYPDLIKFHDFADNKQAGGDEASSNKGCNSGPRGHDFMDNSNINTKCWRQHLSILPMHIVTYALHFYLN